jgi:tetratricopeptide (TPR) repeat protein
VVYGNRTYAYQQGRHAEAEQMLLGALREAERFGPQDFRLAVSCNNLAELYRAQGKYGEAEQLYKRSLAIFENTQGPEHPSVAMSLNNLALLCQMQHRHAEAAVLLQRIIALAEKTLGLEHPAVAENLENYAAVLRRMNRQAEAAEIEFRAQEIRTKRLRGNPGK